jgi:hypothetical protein
MTKWNTADIPDQTGRIAMVTGANTGLGFETAKALAAGGACRGQGTTCTFTAQRPSCVNARFLLTTPTAPPQSLPNVPCPEEP